MNFKLAWMMIFLLFANIVPGNAMVDPLPEKLGALKTNLEILRDELEQFKEKLEGLKEALEEDSIGDDCDTYVEFDLRKEALRWLEKQQALANPPPESIHSWVFGEKQSGTNFLGAMAGYVSAYMPNLSFMSSGASSLSNNSGGFSTSGQGRTTGIHTERKGDLVDVYRTVYYPPDGPWKTEKSTIWYPEHQYPGPPPPPSSNSNIQSGIEIHPPIFPRMKRPPVEIKEPLPTYLSKYDKEQIRLFNGYTEQQWIDSFMSGYDSSKDPSMIILTNKILNNYEDYRFPNFIPAARKTLKFYDEYMLGLVRRINADPKFRGYMKLTPGFGATRKKSSTFLGLIDTEANQIVVKRCLAKGCLNVKNIENIKAIAKKCKEKYLAENPGKKNTTKKESKKNKSTSSEEEEEEKDRIQKRLDSLDKVTEKNGTRLIDYFDKVRKVSFDDPYGEVFDHCCGTVLDQALHEDLCETRIMMNYLKDRFPKNERVQSYGPLVDRITALAKKESDIEMAFDLADFAYDLVDIASSSVGILEKTTTALSKGAYRAVDVLKPSTWVNLAAGAMNLGIFLATGGDTLDDTDQAIHLSMFPNDKAGLLQVSTQYKEKCERQSQAARIALKKLKENMVAMTWDQWLEEGTKFGTELVLTGGACKVAALGASRYGRGLVSSTAKVLRSSESSTCMGGIGAIGKVALEEGSGVARFTNEVIKSNKLLVGKKEKDIIQTVRNVAKDVVETKDFGKVACQPGAKCWLKLNENQLKNIGPKSSQKDIRQVMGTKEDAWEFFKAQVVKFEEIKPGQFKGLNDKGQTFYYRPISKSEGHWPTVDVNGVTGLRKIKFIQ